mmetsp:Transcript_26585/g.67703  ORF Transcript_26585/g.67703 Transcript_26585/m.67703 type:complete len:302 (-) Transcript_26585:1046-1951(-)
MLQLLRCQQLHPKHGSNLSNTRFSPTSAIFFTGSSWSCAGGGGDRGGGGGAGAGAGAAGLAAAEGPLLPLPLPRPRIIRNGEETASHAAAPSGRGHHTMGAAAGGSGGSSIWHAHAAIGSSTLAPASGSSPHCAHPCAPVVAAGDAHSSAIRQCSTVPTCRSDAWGDRARTDHANQHGVSLVLPAPDRHSELHGWGRWHQAGCSPAPDSSPGGMGGAVSAASMAERQPHITRPVSSSCHQQALHRAPYNSGQVVEVSPAAVQASATVPRPEPPHSFQALGVRGALGQPAARANSAAHCVLR